MANHRRHRTRDVVVLVIACDRKASRRGQPLTDLRLARAEGNVAEPGRLLGGSRNDATTSRANRLAIMKDMLTSRMGTSVEERLRGA